MEAIRYELRYNLLIGKHSELIASISIALEEDFGTLSIIFYIDWIKYTQTILRDLQRWLKKCRQIVIVFTHLET